MINGGKFIMNLRAVDYLTTILFACIPVILWFQDVIVVYVPPAYLIIATIAFAVLSQLASEQRVKDAVEEVQRWIIFDYLTTIALAVGPFILAYESLILQQIPPAYVPIAAVGLALFSQFITNKRIQKATFDEPVEEPVDYI